MKRTLLAAALLGLSACATSGGSGLPEGVPADAEQVTRTESNGDQITEYRIAGQLRAVFERVPAPPVQVTVHSIEGYLQKIWFFCKKRLQGKNLGFILTALYATDAFSALMHRPEPRLR